MKKGVRKMGLIEGDDFNIFLPDQTYQGLTYAELIADWMNWLYSSDPDERNDPHLTFLRGNMIGEPYSPESLSVAASSLEAVSDIRLILDRTGFRGITINTDTTIFFSVYDTNFVISDQYEGKVLQTPYELRVAARKEYNMVSVIWATYKKWNGRDWGVAHPMVDDLSNCYAESSLFRLFVSQGNKANREPAYYLQGSQDYLGLSVGTFLLISNLKPGKYRFDFGGISSVEYFTRAVYDITVVNGVEPRIKDISADISKNAKLPKSII
jgi:hypothetical protein